MDQHEQQKWTPEENIEKEKKPVYKKWWFWVLVVFLLLGFAGALSDNNSSTQSASTETTKSESTDNPKVPEDTDNATTGKDEKAAQRLLDDARKKFDSADYPAMIKKTNEIREKYPDTQVASGIDGFINDLVSSVPTITAAELFSRYDENEVSADNEFKNKLFIVTGTVESIGKDILDKTYVTLSNVDGNMFMHPQFFFGEDENEKVASLATGDSVAIIGKITGATLGSPIIKNSFILP